MSEAFSALVIGGTLLAIALIGRSTIGARMQPTPMPIRLRDVADPAAYRVLALCADPTLHPAVARELRIAVLVSTALRTSGDETTAADLLRRTQSVATARSPKAADELGQLARAHFDKLEG